MIGQALKKLAKENGMCVSNGVAYGSLRGYAATMSEGAGYKQIIFSAAFPDPAQKGLFMDVVNGTDVQKLYRVRQLGISPRAIQIVFLDNPGTMKKITAFLDWFIPLLDQHMATKADVCPECGAQTVGGCWKMVNGVAHYMHESCAQKLRDEIAVENETRQQEATGSYALGLAGALLGSVIGAVVWAIVLCLGYVASLVGLLIGWLAEKGYTLLRGKQGKAKIAILIVAIIVGVLVGTLGGYALSFAQLIAEDEAGIMTYSDIPMLMEFTLTDPETQGYVLRDVGMGLLFAALGVFALLRKAGKEVADTKFVDLK